MPSPYVYFFSISFFILLCHLSIQNFIKFTGIQQLNLFLLLFRFHECNELIHFPSASKPLNPHKSGSGRHLTIIYKIIYPLGFFRKKQENLPDFGNGITCAFLCLKIPGPRKLLILLHKNTPMNLSTGVPKQGNPCFQQGYKDSNLEMTESESVALPFGDSPMCCT